MRCTRCGSPTRDIEDDPAGVGLRYTQPTISTDDLEKSVVWCKSCVAAGHEHWWKRRSEK